MPLYEWRCDTCGHEETTVQSIKQYDEDREIPVCHGAMVRKISAPYVQPDIQPYRAVAVDKKTGKMPVINSRREHREYLKRNGYVEIGNDIPKEPPKREVRGDFVTKQEVAEVTKQVLAKQRH